MTENKENNIEDPVTVEADLSDIKVPVVDLEALAVVEEIPAIVPIVSASKITPGRKIRDLARRGGRGGAASGTSTGGRTGRSGSRGDSRDRVKPEFEAKIIDIRRVTRVAAGGRRYSFSVVVVAGNRKGRVGVGLGKGGDTASSVDKATRDAKKHLITVQLSSAMTIPHAVEAKYGSARIMIFPARGRGVAAGSSARTVIELAGIKDISAKILSGSKNRLNNARATIAALEKLTKIPRKALTGNSWQPKIKI